mmetsp:Transcript_26643/g.51962  ORF Transcript_26643/g.51962 Transcript_26643/m.51962 type:complete len:270 (-) Transcript_26643:33-842(-)
MPPRARVHQRSVPLRRDCVDVSPVLEQRDDDVQVALLLHCGVQGSDASVVRVAGVGVAREVAAVGALVLLVLDASCCLSTPAPRALHDRPAVGGGHRVVDVCAIPQQHPNHVRAAPVGSNGESGEDGGGEVHVTALLADLLDGVEVVEAHGVEQEVGLEARRVALVAQPHRLEVSELDERALVVAAVRAEDVPAVPAVVLANDDGEVCVAVLAPEDSLVLDPPRTFLALLRLLKCLHRPPADAQCRVHLDCLDFPASLPAIGRRRGGRE